jgi:hypothetical protein
MARNLLIWRTRLTKYRDRYASILALGPVASK